jgi:hypothetical protein
VQIVALVTPGSVSSAREPGTREITMTSRRSQSYGRVMATLRAMGDTKLHEDERQQIREAADALLFCDDLDAGPEARLALDGIVGLSDELIESGRWLPDSAERLVEDVAGCGPVLLLV